MGKHGGRVSMGLAAAAVAVSLGLAGCGGTSSPKDGSAGTGSISQPSEQSSTAMGGARSVPSSTAASSVDVLDLQLPATLEGAALGTHIAGPADVAKQLDVILTAGHDCRFDSSVLSAVKANSPVPTLMATYSRGSMLISVNIEQWPRRFPLDAYEAATNDFGLCFAKSLGRAEVGHAEVVGIPVETLSTSYDFTVNAARDGIAVQLQCQKLARDRCLEAVEIILTAAVAAR